MNWMRYHGACGVLLDRHDLTAEAQQMRCVYFCALVCVGVLVFGCIRRKSIFMSVGLLYSKKKYIVGESCC